MKCFAADEPATHVPRVSARGRLTQRRWQIRADLAACEAHRADADALLAEEYGREVVVQWIAAHVAEWDERRGRSINAQDLAVQLAKVDDA